jgi:hypothetical protein
LPGLRPHRSADGPSAVSPVGNRQTIASFHNVQTRIQCRSLSIWAFSYADQGTDVTGTGTLSFLDSGGSAFYASNVKTDTEGSIHFGQQFSTSDLPGLPASVSFSGLRYNGTVDAYIDPNVTVRTYETPALYFTAYSFTTTVPVPEPSTCLAGLSALGMLGLFAWRNRK